jgi:hypothetical protein
MLFRLFSYTYYENPRKYSFEEEKNIPPVIAVGVVFN